MKKRKNTLYIIILFLPVLALLGWFVFYIITNTPQRTISKVLSLRNDNDVSEEELTKYFTDDYKKIEKRAKIKLNTSQYNLSDPVKSGGRVEVVLSIKIYDEDTQKMEDSNAARFYLKRSGFFPFMFGYKIDYIQEINPILTATFADLLPKKEMIEFNLGEIVNIGQYNMRFSDYDIEDIEKTGDFSDEEEDIYYIKFLIEELDNKNIEGSDLFFEAGSDNKSCAQLQKLFNKSNASTIEARLLSETDKSCSPDYLILRGAFDKDYKINLK